MSSEVFPTDPIPNYPYSLTPVWKTLVSDYESGREQRRQKWLYAKYDVSLNFDPLEEAESKTLWEFYMARKGSLESFFFIDVYIANHVELYIATCNGTDDVFDIPGLSTSARVLYENGSIVTSGFSYLTGGGDGNSDRIDYTSAPAEGVILTIDFTGYLRVKCRFKEDNLSRDNFLYNLFKYGLKLKGVS